MSVAGPVEEHASPTSPAAAWLQPFIGVLGDNEGLGHSLARHQTGRCCSDGLYRTTQLESLLLAARQRLAWLLWALLFLFSFYGNGSILTILLRRKLLRCTLPIYSFFFLFFQPPGYGRGSGNADGGGAVRALPLRQS